MEELEIKNSLKVSKLLSQFLENEVLNKLNLNVDKFWEDFDHLIKVFAPKNENLLKKREDIKKKIDAYYISNKDKPYNHDDYINFLKEIDYIVPEGPDFNINTENALIIRIDGNTKENFVNLSKEVDALLKSEKISVNYVSQV